MAPGQEYCLTCGTRLTTLPRPAGTADERLFRFKVAGLALVALSGAAIAIVATRDADATPAPLVATGGSVPVEAPDQATRLTPWPAGRDAWTIVLVSIPKVDGQGAAVALAEAARRKGLTPAGVLDSSRYPSLRPGYWMPYTGVYTSEAEANGALRKARPVSRSARVQRVSG